MDLHVRNIDAGAIKIIDDIAKNNNTTRSELLRRHIEDYASYEGVVYKENNLNNTLNQVAKAIEITFNRLEELEDKNTKMFYLLCDLTDIEPEHVEFLFQGDENDG